ncbi:hypothetical protein [Streptomyces sp900116325]
MKNYPPEFKADAVALYESRPDATISRERPRLPAQILGHRRRTACL